MAVTVAGTNITFNDGTVQSTGVPSLTLNSSYSGVTTAVNFGLPNGEAKEILFCFYNNGHSGGPPISGMVLRNAANNGDLTFTSSSNAFVSFGRGNGTPSSSWSAFPTSAGQTNIVPQISSYSTMVGSTTIRLTHIATSGSTELYDYEYSFLSRVQGGFENLIIWKTRLTTSSGRIGGIRVFTNYNMTCDGAIYYGK